MEQTIMEKITIELKEVREKQIVTEHNIKSIDKSLQELSIEFREIVKILNQNLVFSEKIKNIEEDLKESRQIGKDAVISIREEIREMKETNNKYKFAFVSFAFTLVAGIILFVLKEAITKT